MSKRFTQNKLDNWHGTIFVTDPTYGDNGKGKLVDLLAQQADMVIRTNGGANAGHTVLNELGEFKLHLIPSGIFNPRAISILSDTVAINPLILTDEINLLKGSGVEISSQNLLISKNAHLTMPWHRMRDGLNETARGGGRIGTTGQGIGPTYSDRAARVGLRAGDLLLPNLKELFEKEIIRQEKLTRRIPEKDQIFEELLKAREILAPMIVDVLPVIWDYKERNKNILGEAGQGVLLDLDRGNYPYVTSSHPGIAGFNLASGLSPYEVDKVIAVTKVYATRVGSGPLPTELTDQMGDFIREKGHEFGATTGRARRCGWLDIPATRYGCRVGGATSLVLTKLDIFDGLEKIKICIGYRVGNNEYTIAPTADLEFMESVTPVYETLPGWDQETSKVRSFRDLNKNAQRFIERVQELTGIPIEMVSVGPERNASIYLEN